MGGSSEDESLALFLSLWKYLTGEPDLDSEVARRHYQRLQSVLRPEALPKLLDEWRAAQKEPAQTSQRLTRILSDSVLGPAAKTLILLWYTGGIKTVVDGNNVWQIESATDYFTALAWKVVGSHPPGLSNQFFGHWKYPTEY